MSRQLGLRTRNIIVMRDGPLCFWCDRQTREGNAAPTLKDNTRTIDHFVSKFHGGTNAKDNLVIACHRCNIERGTLSHGEWKVVLDSRSDVVCFEAMDSALGITQTLGRDR